MAAGDAALVQSLLVWLLIQAAGLTCAGVLASVLEAAQSSGARLQSRISSSSDPSSYWGFSGGASSVAGTYPDPSVRLPAGPRLVALHSQNVTASLNGTAILNCRVHHIGSHQVSWGRDIEVLTGNRMRFTDDRRIEPIHQEYSKDWGLRIAHVRKSDTGWYFCQISTTPPVSHNIYLHVVEPVVEIVGGPDLYINRGSSANLTCIIRDAHRPPANVRWSHDNKLVQFDRSRGGVRVETSHERSHTASHVLIQHALPADSGEYFCDPDGLPPARVVLHVLDGDHPAAMQTGRAGSVRTGAASHLLLALSPWVVVCACRLPETLA